jgi:hypothetical protein
MSGVPGSCVDALPQHAQNLQDAAVRPDGQVVYVRLQGENEPWYAVDLMAAGGVRRAASPGVSPGLHAHVPSAQSTFLAADGEGRGSAWSGGVGMRLREHSE